MSCLCCYFANGERVTFNMTARCRPRALICSVGERPTDWEDFDAQQRRIGHPHVTPATIEEFEAEYGPIQPPDGEG